MVLERFGDLEVYLALEEELGRSLTLHEVIAAELATVRAPLDEVVAWLLEHVRVRPGFRELVAEHDPLIVSAGFHETIEPILRRERVEARVVANRVTADPGGWRTIFAERATCATLRRALQAGGGRRARAVRLRRRRRLRSLCFPRGRAPLRAGRARALARRAGRRLRVVRRPARRAAGALGRRAGVRLKSDTGQRTHGKKSVATATAGAFRGASRHARSRAGIKRQESASAGSRSRTGNCAGDGRGG